MIQSGHHFPFNIVLLTNLKNTFKNILNCLQYFNIISINVRNITGVNPLTPTSDQDRTSPYNINTVSCRKVMRINTNINQGIIS